ncbi:MAG: mannitol dehydrogenase [Clostridiales bacterium]|nr:mannitol dehydrogenase [Clostridiales bacterium]
MGTAKTAVMIGAGNIGRGFVGAAFAASGYETVFIDVDEKLVDEINARGEYPVRILLPDGGVTETVARGVRAVSGKDMGAAATEIARADICATAVGVRAIENVASTLALGLALRIRKDLPPLNIIVCENMLDAGEKLREYVMAVLPAELAPAVDAVTGYPEAVIGRMVPTQTEDMKDGDPLRVCVEKYAFLPVDREAFKGHIPQIKGMVPLDRFGYYVKRKLFIHNMGHAAVAYLGLLKGYNYIAEAVDDADILYLVHGAMNESAAALGCENPGDAANLNRSISSLLYRFANEALGDTCARVAADPVRKLDRHDRLIGALENCQKYALPSTYIAAVAAAAALALERSPGESPARLTKITGLSLDSEAYKLITELCAACAAAMVRGEDAVAELRRTAARCAGDITIL